MRIVQSMLLSALLIANAHAAEPVTTAAAPGNAEPATTAAAAGNAEPVEHQSRRLTEFLDAEFEQYLALVPELALSMGLKTHAGEISDRSEAGDEKILQW